MGKKAATIAVAFGLLLAATILVLVLTSNSAWVPYLSRSRIPPPVIVRVPGPITNLRVFPGVTGVFFILPDGSLWRWGQNGGDRFPRAAVPEPVGTNHDWLQAFAANGHCVAVRTNGTLWTWGTHSGAPLASPRPLGSFIPSPEQVGGEYDWAAATAGDLHSTALKRDGTVWAWGSDTDGQMGNGVGPKETNLLQTLSGTFRIQTIQTNSVQVGTNRDWIAISGTGTHTLGLRQDGTLWVWGRTPRFQNGQPEAVLPVPTQVCRETNWVGLGPYSALNRNGELWQAFNAPPDASAPASVACYLFASNCVPAHFVLAGFMGFYQLHADGTLWVTSIGNLMPDNQWHRVGKRADWVSIWGFGSAIGLTADGTVWTWSSDPGQEPVMRLSSRVNLLKTRVRGWLGMGSSDYTREAIGQVQREPRPLFKIITASPTQAADSDSPR
jgi:hypothetical protein